MNNHFTKITLNQAIEKYDLGYIDSYIVENYGEGLIYLFEEDAHFENLDLDAAFYTVPNPDAPEKIWGAVFLKNLMVDNLLVQEESDYGPTVIVKGNTTAKNIYVSGGNIYFRGDVTVEQTLVCGVYNHGQTDIDGEISAEIIITIDHSYNINHQKIKKGVFVDEDELMSQDEGTYLPKKYWSEENGLGDILKPMRKGESILAKNAGTSKLQLRIEKARASKNKKLDLGRLDLTEIPKEVFQETYVEILEIKGHLLTDIPAEISTLSNLKTLVYWNHGEYGKDNPFPKNICQLKNLTQLDLYGGKFRHLPEEFVQLSQLKKIDLARTYIAYFPEVLYQLPNLEELDISDLEESEEIRSTKDLDAALKGFGRTMLKIYKEMIAEQQLTEITVKVSPEIIINKPLPKLKKLNVSYNPWMMKIETPLPELTEIDITQCGLTEFPSVLFQSKKLKKLIMYGNRLEELPADFAHFTKLTELSINLYMLKKNPTILSQLPKLNKLHIVWSEGYETLFDNVLEAPQWTELEVSNYEYEEKREVKILSRPNLKKLTDGDREINIAEGRQHLGIKM